MIIEGKLKLFPKEASYNYKWTIPLKEAASLLRDFLPWSFAALTLLSLNVSNQKS